MDVPGMIERDAAAAVHPPARRDCQALHKRGSRVEEEEEADSGRKNYLDGSLRRWPSTLSFHLDATAIAHVATTLLTKRKRKNLTERPPPIKTDRLQPTQST